MKSSKWYAEPTSENEVILHLLKEVIYNGRSPFQKIEVIETGNYGKCLFLDGILQSAETDEFIYHEALVHPAMLLCEDPKRVFIGGGGEGATVREVVRYPVSEIVMVDLDEEVVRVCREFLPEWSNGAFDDPRVKVVYADARNYLSDAKEKFDVIILDLTHLVEGGPARLLYTEEFYRIVYNALTEKGVMVTQFYSLGISYLQLFASLVTTVNQVFSCVKPYVASIPSFFAPWGFVLAAKSTLLDEHSHKFQDRLAKVEKGLKFYDLDSHRSMFYLPKHIKEALVKGGDIIRDKGF